MLEDFATSIVQTLRQCGFQAYLVGGCVRDLLLGREPKDYDVATDATPPQVMEIFPETYAVGAQFGVVLVPAPRDEPGDESASASSHADAVEVATFREDIGYSDGRHPDKVRFSQDPREDVARRDFTINGMLLDPLSGQMPGEVLDFVGGRKDLEAGIIRAIGDPEQRFEEDKLRMLRAVRFAARFGYSIEAADLCGDAEAGRTDRGRVARAGARRVDTHADGRQRPARVSAAGLEWSAETCSAGNFRDEGSGAASGVSS
jgi:poly(A) polymerase